MATFPFCMRASYLGKGYILGQQYTNGEKYQYLQFESKTIGVTSASATNAGSFGRTGFSSLIKGYVAGGQAGSYTIFTTINGLLFLNETASNIVAVLSKARRDTAPVSSGIKGYCMGGYNNAEGAYQSVIDGIAFSNEAAFNAGNLLTTARMGPQSGGANATRGYMFGGDTGSVSALVDGILFSNDSHVSSAHALGTATNRVGVAANLTNAYTFGGFTSANVNTIQRFPWATETFAGAGSSLAAAVNSVTAVKTGISAFLENIGTGTVTAIYEFIYATETNAAIAATLTYGPYAGTSAASFQSGTL
jgi:hypothetical protein